MFVRDHYYSGCPNLGRGLPVEIELSKKHVQIENDWFLDDLLENISPEDAMIDMIDGNDSNPMFVDGKLVKDFDFYELTSKTLTPYEYHIFYAHYVEDKSYRVLGRELNIAYTKVFAIYQQSLQKLREAILRDLSDN
jgi:DNA-directed RNA polymerase specialized sigma24 family protein